MEQNSKTIKPETKRFRLVKFFAYASFVILIVSTFVLSMIISQRATKVLRNTYENHALLIANNLNHQVFHYFTIPVRYRYGAISLRQKEQFDLMDKIVRTTIHSLNIENVNMYDTEKGQIAYSTNRDLVGLTGRGGMGYESALEGKHSSRLITREDSVFGTWLLDFAKEKKLKTFIPFKAEPPYSYIGILGVFEVTQDLTEEYESILRFRYLIFGVSLVVMFLIFLALLLVVRKAERTLARRAREQKLLEDQLNQAERLAVLGEMVAGVSHEIKNPLGIIRSTAELLAEKSEHSQAQKKLSNIIIEESGRLNDIVTDFLDFARPQVPNLQDCPLGEVIERNVTFLRPELDKKGVIVNDGNLNGRPYIIEADPGLLRQAFLNIFINAIQAMEDGGNITINIEEEKGNYRVEIQDTGIGIRDENLKKIFSPFFTTKDEGSGLGLSIVKNIIEGHKGKVWIESKEGVGTKVFVSLPRKQ
ncbi:MAG: GHKL domain-containing protein [Deltaproteobacteria bacterium]|nr:MAG: GHKL domain-containing protein [Deltaproteobacteria bacterium]